MMYDIMTHFLPTLACFLWHGVLDVYGGHCFLGNIYREVSDTLLFIAGHVTRYLDYDE